MITLTIEYEDKEWFLDRALNELREVNDPTHVIKFTALTPGDIAEVERALEYRAEEVEELQDTMRELAYPEKDDKKATKHVLWGK